MPHFGIHRLRPLLPLIVSLPFVVGLMAGTAAREARAVVVGFGASLLVGVLVLLASPRSPGTAQGRRVRVPLWVVLLVVIALSGIAFIVWFQLGWSDWTF